MPAPCFVLLFYRFIFLGKKNLFTVRGRQDEYGDAVLPVHLLYSRDRDMEVGSKSGVDAGGHYDILNRLT